MIANARMYSVAPGAAAAWRVLFDHVAKVSGVALDVVEHPFPLPVSDLWRRDDLLLAFMCGWPWVRGGARHVAVAAPLPVGANGPFYWSDLVVHRDSPACSLSELAGQRAGFTLLDSQSGFSALRHHLRLSGGPAFGGVVGPLVTPRRMLESIGGRQVDVGPVDSFAHALLRRHAPEVVAPVRVLARTAPTPVPMLVASPGADREVVARLRAALFAVQDPALLEPLCITGFGEPRPENEYRRMEAAALEAEAEGMHDLSAFMVAAAA